MDVPAVPVQHVALHTCPCRAQRCRRGMAVQAAAPAAGALPLALPQLLPASGPWGVWCGLICAGAFGMWAEVSVMVGHVDEHDYDNTPLFPSHP